MHMAAQFTLAEFEQEIRILAGDKAGWPFLCDGSPFDCQIFLVGINPVVGVPLWDYWSPESGVNRTAWLSAYRKERKFTQTRHRIEWLVEVIRPEARVLETNVFHHCSPRESGLDPKLRDPKVFTFLLETLKPKIVFVHGGLAVREFKKVTKTDFKRDTFTKVNYKGSTFDVLSDKHLYNWSRDKVEQLSVRLRERWAACTA
jgi:hypothetical protein